MAHKEQREFIEKVKKLYPNMFEGKKIVDFGSLDINGSNKSHFINCDYTGVDIGHGKNVDVISKCHKFKPPKNTLYDVVITTEMLEHDMYWKESLQKMVEILKSNGLLIITCATTGRPPHGLPSVNPGSSPLTCAIPEWQNHYHNLTKEDVSPYLSPEKNFSVFEHTVNEEHKDYQFYGIKK